MTDLERRVERLERRLTMLENNVLTEIGESTAVLRSLASLTDTVSSMLHQLQTVMVDVNRLQEQLAGLDRRTR